MDSLTDLMERAHRLHLNKHQIKTLVIGTVDNVQNDATCDVHLDDGLTLFDVRLHAVDDASTNKFTAVPAQGSMVVCGILENQKTEAVVLMCNDVSKYRLQTGSAVFQIRPNIMKIEAGGQNLKVQLNLLIDEIIKIVVLYGRSPNIPALTQIKANINLILE